MDRRISKTKSALKSALAELMEDKDYKDISITDLCDKANVNRGTFYLHYKSISNFINEIEEELIAKLSKLILISYPLKTQDDYYSLCNKIVNIVKEDQDFLSKLVGPHGDSGFVRRISHYTKELALKLNKFNLSEEDGQYLQFYLTFVVDGGIGVLVQWLINRCKDDIISVLKQFTKLIIKAAN